MDISESVPTNKIVPIRGLNWNVTYKKLKKKHNKIVELLNKGISKAEIARLMGCTWQTLHRYIKECIAN